VPDYAASVIQSNSWSCSNNWSQHTVYRRLGDKPLGRQTFRRQDIWETSWATNI